MLYLQRRWLNDNGRASGMRSFPTKLKSPLRQNLIFGGPPPWRNWKSWWKGIVGFVGASATLIGLITGALFFFPHVQFAPAEPRGSAQIPGSFFQITNSSVGLWQNVEVSCEINSYLPRNRTSLVRDSLMSNYQNMTSKLLEVDDSMTVECPLTEFRFLLRDVMGEVDLTVRADFQYAHFLPRIRLNRAQRFVGNIDRGGQIVWQKQPTVPRRQ